MSDSPEYKGYDPRKPKGERLTIQDILSRFHDEMPEGTVAVNLGSGQRPQENMINVDSRDLPTVDLVADLYKPDWPLEDDSVGLIWMSHFLEHVPDWEAFWQEAWRIVADQARVVVLGPWFMSDRFWQDPTHKCPLLDAKFTYLNRQWRVDNQIEHDHVDVNFIQEYDTIDSYASHLNIMSTDVKRDAKMRERNSLTDCVWFLKALKTEESMTAYMDKLARDQKV